MRNLLKALTIVVLLTILVYVSNISSIPERIILFQGEELNVYTVLGIDIECNETMQASLNLDKNAVEDTEIGKSEYTVSLFRTSSC